MPIPQRMTTGEALDHLAKLVERLEPDYLAEVHAELFPSETVPRVDSDSRSIVVQKLARRIRDGLEPEDVVDVWGLFDPESPKPRYDKKNGDFRFSAKNRRSGSIALGPFPGEG